MAEVTQTEAVMPNQGTRFTARHWGLILITCQALLVSGCTGMLWEKERFARCHWAASPPGLRLHYSESAQDVLAEYDEQAQGTTSLQHRAYWIQRNSKKVLADRQPEFVSVTNAQDLAAVPITDAATNPPAASYRGLYAVVATNGLAFTLYSENKDPAVYRLPVYYAGSGQRVKQVLLTPFAVATDATVVGGLIAMVAGYVVAATGSEEAVYSAATGRRK
jgi:hypothetical protein